MYWVCLFIAPSRDSVSPIIPGKVSTTLLWLWLIGLLLDTQLIHWLASDQSDSHSKISTETQLVEDVTGSGRAGAGVSGIGQLNVE